MKSCVAVIACVPPDGKSSHLATDCPDGRTWFMFVPDPPLVRDSEQPAARMIAVKIHTTGKCRKFR
jgi:hypothetical protein